MVCPTVLALAGSPGPGGWSTAWAGRTRRRRGRRLGDLLLVRGWLPGRRGRRRTEGLHCWDVKSPSGRFGRRGFGVGGLVRGEMGWIRVDLGRFVGLGSRNLEKTL